MKRPIAALICLLVFSGQSFGFQSTLLPDEVIGVLAQEISGETAKRNLEFLSRQHRMRGSRGFRVAAEYIVEQLRSYGLADARVEQFPADGKIFYGTQRSRPPWDADFAELVELLETGQSVRIASWDAMPITLAQDSENGDVTAELVDVGSGTSEQNYAGKAVRGKLVLVSSQPEAVVPLAVARHGAAGIVSYAQNQRTAWWGENDNLVRWGHLDTFATVKTFAFMVSLKQARTFQTRLSRGEKIQLQAKVRAGKHAGFYDVVTATIPGGDARLKEEEIVFSCHLDHPRPGANDNASGAVAILEVARTLASLIREGKLPRPARTIRFVWPPEIEGTIAFLNARPEVAARIKAAIHMDMVGGGPETKAIFHVTRGPMSLPSFIYDVAEHFGEFVNQQSAAFASGRDSSFPLVAPEGGKEALLAEMVEFSLGSDHQVYTDSSWSIPAIYLNDWPDRYIHTNFDTPANIDPTKLKRSAFIGAASGYFLANLKPADGLAILRLIESQSLRRAAVVLQRRSSPAESINLAPQSLSYERQVLDSISRFVSLTPQLQAEANHIHEKLAQLLNVLLGKSIRPETGTVFRRNSKVKGPMTAFGYDYFSDHYGAERVDSIRLLRYQGLRGSGGEYAYESLNLVDGKRTVEQIHDVLSAAYGPIPLEVVMEYLSALESIKMLERVN